MKKQPNQKKTTEQANIELNNKLDGTEEQTMNPDTMAFVNNNQTSLVLRNNKKEDEKEEQTKNSPQE